MNIKTFFIAILVALVTCNSYAATKILTIEHWNTSNGTAVYFVAAPQLPMLDIKLAFDAGAARDGDALGVASLTSALLNQGNQGQDATQIAENFENVGAQFDASTNRDHTILSLRTLTKATNLNAALQNFATVINHPDFLEVSFLQKKAEQALALKARLQSAATLASDIMFSTVYPNQPYSNPVLGSDASLKQLTLPKVTQFYHRYYVGNNATLALVGAIDLAQAKQIAEQLTKEMPAGEKPPAIPLATQLATAIVRHVAFPATQTVIYLAQVGITHASPDYFTLLVGNYTLGSGTLVSRLADTVREKRGLSYYIYSYFNPLPARGPFIITLATRQDKAQQALELTKATLQQFLAQGPTADELLAAKQYLTGSFPLRLASNASIADILIMIGSYHLPLDYLDHYISNIEAVTSEQIKSAFQRQVQPQHLAIITVGNNG